MKNIYFDNIITTPLHPKAAQAMKAVLEAFPGHPLSLHSGGTAARELIETSRSSVAKLMKAGPEEIYFTSSGTESNNWAVKGACLAQKSKKKIMISSVEHLSVLHPARSLARAGYEAVYIPVDRRGSIDLDFLSDKLDRDYALVSVLAANNEIGTVQPVADISGIVRGKGVPLHFDCTLFPGLLPIDAEKWGADFITVSAHHFYGPSGIGALYVKNGARINPLIEGGLQEGGLRGGMHNLAGIAGMAEAALLADKDLEARRRDLSGMSGYIIDRLKNELEEIIITGDEVNRVPGHVSFCVKYIEGESAAMYLESKGISISTGSTCSQFADKESHVLRAVGVSEEDSRGSLLAGAGIFNTMEDAALLVDNLLFAAGKLREMSPLWMGKK